MKNCTTFETHREDASRIAKDIIKTAKKHEVTEDSLLELINGLVFITTRKEFEKSYKEQTEKIKTKEQAAEWLAKQWKEEQDNSESDDFGETFGWDDTGLPIAKDFLNNPSVFESYANHLLDFDAETPVERAYYNLVSRVINIGLDRKKG